MRWCQRNSSDVGFRLAKSEMGLVLRHRTASARKRALAAEARVNATKWRPMSHFLGNRAVPQRERRVPQLSCRETRFKAGAQRPFMASAAGWAEQGAHPAGVPRLPAVQTVPAAHACPHAPQLCASL